MKTGKNGERFTLPVHYVRVIADQIRALGGDPVRWLSASGLAPKHLDDPSFALSYETFASLVRTSLIVSREPALGLFVGERLLATSHGIVGYAAMASGTLRQAIELLERYSALRTTLLSIAHSTSAGVVRVRFKETRPLGDIRRPVLEAVVMSITKVLASISTGACHISEVSFAFESPEYAALARDLFGCEVGYGRTWTGFAFHGDLLDAPLTMGDPEAFAQTTRICQRMLEELAVDESVASRIRRLLLESQSGFPSLQVAARLARMTPRTLHRRLVAEGTSYRELLEEVRHAVALEHLKSEGVGLEKIAYTLGYSDLANFRRAFKRWEGVSPSSYRAAHATMATEPRSTLRSRR